MNIKSHAPILIIVYDRFNHFKRCVESLQRCTGAEHTDLFVALDYPKHETGLKVFKQIYDYTINLKGFKNVTVLERTKNLGHLNNFNDAKNYIEQKYDRMILTEDDNEFSVNFLEYINKGLDKFEDDPRIIAVCGDGGLLKKPQEYDSNYLYRKGFSAWGYGTWKNRLGKTEYSAQEMIGFIADRDLRRKLIYNYESHYYSVLSRILQRQIIYGDGAIALDMIKNDTYCVYPTLSKVRNHGHDGSGVHGGELIDSPYMKIEIDSDESFDFKGDPIFDHPKYIEQLKSSSEVSFIRKIKFWLRAYKYPIQLIKIIYTLNIGSKRVNVE